MQEKLVASNYYLNKSAKEAYRSYILAYKAHSMKDIFNLDALDLQVCTSLLQNLKMLGFWNFCLNTVGLDKFL